MNHHNLGDAQYGTTKQNKDSFITNAAALVLFLFIVVPILLNTPHLEFARGILVFGYRMTSRFTSRLLSYTPVSLQKSVLGLESSVLKSGLEALKGPKSNTPPGLGNCNNSCYQNSIVQVCSMV